MAKQPHSSPKRHTAHKGVQQSSAKPLIPEQYQSLAYCVALALAVLIFLRGTLFGGGIFFASDNIASGSFVPFLEAAKKSGEFPLWLPYIFSGLPSYAALLTTGDRWWDFIMVIFHAVTNGFGTVLQSDAARVGSYYTLYGIGMFLLMRSKQQSRFVAFFTAFSAVFSTFIIVWVMIGHNTKPIALMTFPYILMCLEKIRERFSWFYAALLAVITHILVESTHVQMVFYGVCCFGLYFVFEIVSRLIKKEAISGVLRAAGILAVAGGLSFAMASDRYLSVMEYTQYSTRGTAPIEKAVGQKQDAAGGFDYEYATNWSFSPQEMMTFLVPNYFGFGKMKVGNEVQSTYWGQMPFTDAANYMGIGVLALAVFGAWHWRRDTFVQFLVAMAVFALILSFGKNFPLLYNLFFNLVPNFNKFRAPQMALALMQFAVPILAGYGLTGILGQRNTTDHERHSAVQRKWLLVGVGGAALFLLAGFAFSAVGKEQYVRAVGDATSEQYQSVLAQVRDNPQQLAAYKERIAQIAGERGQQIYTLMIEDWYATALLGLASMLTVWLLVRGTLPQWIGLSLLGLFMIIDLWRVSSRPMEISKQNYQETVFRKTDAISFIQNDKSLYRVADFNQSPNVMAYFGLQHIHGYHSAKLRIYQDLLDVAGNGGGSVIANPFLWNMMNVKYLLSERPLMEGMQPVFKSQEAQMLVYENPSVLPRAFFVNRAEVGKQMDILQHLKNGDFAPLEVAYLEKPLPQPIDTVVGDMMEHINRVKSTVYKNEKIAFEVEATGNNLLFLSEVYYPAGWKAYIDGKETEIFKTNYAFRSVIVPQGKHTVEMRFTSDRFGLGKNLSLACNVLVLAVLGFGVWQWRKEKRQA
ncbi:MAG: YfhO family protein [Candidatus Kapaibacteriota bacterium]